MTDTYSEPFEDVEDYADAETVQETWQVNLEGQALAIVQSEANRQCVQAGPGTGKSYCMTRRILRLIQQQKVKPHEVLAVTFTRNASIALRKSLTDMLGQERDDFRASTLHSLCFSIVEGADFLRVRNRHPRFLLTFSKSGCLQFEAAPMLSDLQEENADYEAATAQTKRLKAFEAMWARRQDDPLGVPESGTEQSYGSSVRNWLRFHKGMLVGELVKEAFAFLFSEPDTPWRSRFKAILVDEYQDLNRLDQEVIDLLCEASDLTCSVVGDIDQSIYAFRCAHPDGLVEYGEREDVEALTMEISWRCPRTHLAAAQNHIQKNTKRAQIYPSPQELAQNGEISVRRWADRATEVQGVVAFVKHCMAQGVPLGEILVMVPSRKIGQEIRDALGAEDGIEAQSYFDEEQLEKEEAQKAFTLLALLADKGDRIALRCWLGGWMSGHRAGNYKKLRAYCEANHTEPWETMEKLAAGEIAIPGTNHLVEPFRDLQSRLDGLEDCAGRELLNKVFPPEAEWADGVRALADESIEDDTSPKKLYEHLADSITQAVIPTEVSYVRVMSLHKAKGLTVRAAAIAGCVEGLVPRPYDPEKSDITEVEHEEEQRRLFYVAMTRSTEYLLICAPRLVDREFANKYQLPGGYEGRSYRTQVSSFVTDLPLLPRSHSRFTFP